MNAHQRKKFAKALMSDLKNSTEDEKLQSIVDAAADLAKQGRKMKQYEDEIDALRRTVAEQKEQLAEARKDADRYRWFRNVAPNIFWNSYEKSIEFFKFDTSMKLWNPVELDTATDAAMQGDKP